MNILFQAIQSKLRNSQFVFLITDLWTDFQMTDFIALAALIVDQDWNKEFLILDMKEMEGKHNAENVQIAIEKIVNKFDFDKSKIKGNCVKKNQILE